MMFDKRFIFVENKLVNTGGNCMVEKVTVYDQQESAIIWLMVAEDSLAMYSFDWIDYDADWIDDDYSNIMLNCCSSVNESANCFRELYEFGYQQYIIDFCKFLAEPMMMTYDDLPFKLQISVSSDLREWYNDNGLLFATDGEKILIDSRYITFARRKLFEE